MRINAETIGKPAGRAISFPGIQQAMAPDAVLNRAGSKAMLPRMSPGAVPQSPARLVSIDAYRGFVMFLLKAIW
jgi:hypothetical protein